MGTQRLLPGYGVFEETNADQHLLPGYGVLNESVATGATISCTPGNASAACPTAVVGLTIPATAGNASAACPTAVVSNNASTTINCTVGNAAAGGPTATVYQGLVIAGLVGNAAAAGSTASVATYLVLDFAINNTETAHITSQAVSYSWWPGGRIGSMVGITPQDFSGTIGADGHLVTTLLKATGVIMMAKRITNAVDDEVFYQAFP